MAYHLLQHDRDGAREARPRAAVAAEHRAALRAVQHLHRSADLRRCASDERAIATLLCVVETPADQIMLEQTLTYRGLYFVLMGRL